MIDNWYPDPSGAHVLRYWRGLQWTNDVQGRDGNTFTDHMGPEILRMLPPPAGGAAIPLDTTTVARQVDWGTSYADVSQARLASAQQAQLDWNPAPVIVQPASTNTCAVASMVMGIIGLMSPLLGLFGIIPLYLGKRARHQMEYSHRRQSGEGMATAGIIMGWIQVGIGVLVLLVLLLTFATAT